MVRHYAEAIGEEWTFETYVDILERARVPPSRGSKEGDRFWHERKLSNRGDVQRLKQNKAHTRLLMNAFSFGQDRHVCAFSAQLLLTSNSHAHRKSLSLTLPFGTRNNLDDFHVHPNNCTTQGFEKLLLHCSLRKKKGVV